MLRLFLLLISLLMTAPAVLSADETRPAPANSPTLLAWGDSLSAAYGIPAEKGWVSLLQEKLEGKFTLVNGSISGETTAGGLARLPEALAEYKPAGVLLELGANDGLRGIQLDEMRGNLEQMIQLARQANAKIVLIGIRLPPNYGVAFNDKFDAVYQELAEKYKLAFAPFLLEGVADNFDLMQADGLHPTAEAQPKLLENVWPALEASGLTNTGQPAASH